MRKINYFSRSLSAIILNSCGNESGNDASRGVVLDEESTPTATEYTTSDGFDRNTFIHRIRPEKNNTMICLIESNVSTIDYKSIGFRIPELKEESLPVRLEWPALAIPGGCVARWAIIPVSSGVTSTVSKKEEKTLKTTINLSL